MLTSGQHEAATLAARALIQRSPYDVTALTLTARCLVAGQDYNEALQLYDRILLQEDTDVVWLAKARCLLALGRYQRASMAFARATALAGHQGFISEQAECLLSAGRPAEALKLLDGNPAAQDDTRHQLVQAKTLAQVGQLQEAYEIASKLAPHDQTGQAIKLAGQCRPQGLGFSELCRDTLQKTTATSVLVQIAKAYPHLISARDEEQLDEATQSADATDPIKAQAHLALFEVNDHRKDSAAALAHLRQFHACVAKRSNRRSYESALFTKLMQLSFVPLQSSKTSVSPIFVTGLPGSGCQAAANLLTQAAGCSSAYPLSVVPAVMSRFIRTMRDKNSNHVTREDMTRLQFELREGLHQAANGNEIVVDTTLTNFKWSGLLAAALPEARIIHMKRDPMTTGWALHTGGSDVPEFYCQHSLEKIRAYQRHCDKLMTYWEAYDPSKILNISGDALERPSAATAQALIDTCQLKWSAKCELIHEQTAPKWHRYAAYLRPLRQDENNPIALLANQTLGETFQT
jgi:tetratricopeptide (TPR) repeat protein